MKVNKQNKIKIPKSGFKRSRFNWNHDVNTTFSWGEIQPTQCKMLIPGSKTTMSTQSLIRLAPMVAPTFGRVKYKTYNQFVSMAEIMPNFDAMMAQEPIATGGGTQVPQTIPYVKNGILSSWVLQGARATLYFAQAGTYNGIQMSAQQAAEAGYYRTWYRESPTAQANSTFATLVGHLTGNGGPISSQPAADAFNHAANSVLPEVNGITLTLGQFGTAYANVFGTTDTQIVLGSKNIADLCPVKRSFTSPTIDVKIKDFQQEVTLDGADYILEGSYVYDTDKKEYFALAVELSDYGKRIRKALQGCGYQINFTDNTEVSILPLFATYKAYFDIFGLELYQGWETTWCAKAIKYIENAFIGNCNSVFVRSGKAALAALDITNFGIPFMMTEIANMWYTDDADYVSAHISKLGVSPLVKNAGFIDLGSDSAIEPDQPGTFEGMNVNYTLADRIPAGYGVDNSQVDNGTAILGSDRIGGVAYIDRIKHTQIDSELLKRIYRWTNRNTILGRRIAELLRAQGLGKYVDECKSNYIGSTDTLITISDVVSVAATEDAALGEYGGKGLQYVNDKTLVFENDSYGYWITLATVVPEAGYTQGADPTLTSLDKFNLYNPDFDAIGMELTPKRNVVNTNYITGQASDGSAGFGFVPRYTKFKVCNNLVNGDFNRHNKRNTYLPYTLDKQLNVNDYQVINSIYQEDNTAKMITTALKRSARVGDMPIAGNTWRYPTKYNWLGNFNRIFLNIGEKDDTEIEASEPTGAIGFNDYNDDNFLSHSIVDLQCYAPMKPIEDSYGLDDDDSDHGGVEFVSKA